MKKIMTMCAVVILSALTMSVNAGERGKFIHVDASVNKDLKPQLAFYQERQNGADKTTMLLWTVNTNQYNEFTDASRLLIRFSDGTTARLEKVAGSEVQKEKFSKKNANATISYYKTITSYNVTPEFIDKLQEGKAIVKLRVVFKENDAKDYEIAESYQNKMREDLVRSYKEAYDKNRKSATDLSDEDF